MRKIISALLTFLFVFNSLSSVYAGTSLADAMAKENLYVKSPGTQLMTWKGVISRDNFAPALIVYSKDGKEYPAYCLDPDKAGVEDIGAKNYDVDVDECITNPKVWGVITNGYPYKTPAELGLNSDYEAYYATKMALWATVHANYSNINDWAANGAHNAHVEAAMKSIYAAGNAVSSIPSTIVKVTPDSSIALEVENTLEQSFSVSSNVLISEYTVSLGTSAPAGTKITGLNDNPKTVFQNNEKFKVVIPRTNKSREGSFPINISVNEENKAILWGQSHSDKQDYAVVPKTFDLVTAQATANFIERTGDTPPPPPTPGKLLIKKIEAGTTKGLAGAVFRITKADGGIVGDFVTDTSGQITISLEAYGAYFVDELVPPAGYQLDINNHKDIVITPDQTAVLTFANKPVPELEIIKIDADTGEKLKGAVIRIAIDGGSQFVDVVTDNTGTARLVDLKDGTYTVTEITAPSGYLLNSTPQMVKIESGNKTVVTIKNSRKPGLRIKKYDEDTGLPLPGAEFSVAKKGGAIVYEGITDKSGAIILEGLEPGWYTITEIAAPKGYLIATESKDVYLEPNKALEVKFDNRLRPSLQIIKLDSQTNNPLQGAKFHVRKTEDGTVSEFVTDETGTIIINDLDEAIYTVVEFEAPDGYLLDPQHKDIKLEWGKTKTLVFSNKAKPSLEILKIDEDTKKPLEGSKFRVTRSEGNTTSEYVTDKNGRILITGLEAEIYTVEEIVAPFGYLLEAQHKDIQLEWGRTKTLVFTNKARPTLEIKKIDAITGKPLSGARFKVTKTEDKTVSEYATDETGIITVKNLDESVYTVEEIAAPEGYILEPQHKEIALEWGKTKTLIYENTRKPTLIVTKINALTYKPIPNATFRIEYENASGGRVALGAYRTDKNGQIILPKVNPGWYVITETIAAPGFSLPKNPVTRVYLSPGENAYLEDGSTTGTEPALPSAPSAGDTDGTNITVTSGNEYKPTIVNGEEIFNYPLNSIVIKKVNANTGELLAGAAFEVRKVSEDISGNSGTVIGRYVTDNSGIIVITGLEAGAYIVEEVQPPTNYLLSENSKQQAWLKPDGTSIVEVTFSNYPYGSILVTKVDALTGKPLANARFKVTDGAHAVVGNTNGEYTTNENGEFLVPNVKPGSYVVTELEAPEGYVIETTPQTVNVGTDGKVYKVSFKNQPIGTLVILKLDSATKAPLAGAEFKVTDSKGAVVGTGNGIFKTDSKGTITIPNLQKGAYIVEEIKAPEGYVLENQTKTVEVDYGKTYTLEFFNKPLASLIIKKLDSQTKEPLMGARFKVTKKSGDIIGEYTTDGNGIIQLDDLSPGWYSAVEVAAPNGYKLVETARDFEITHTKTVTLEFFNEKLTSLIIKKLDDKTGAPLKGAAFTVEKQNGQIVGNFTTDTDGLIIIPTLAPDFYIVRETKAPEGYALEETPKTVEVKTTAPTVVTFTNKLMAGLQVKKINSVTRQPISGVEFSLSNMNGERIGNFKTGADGLFFVPQLEPGWYSLYEVKAADGFILDSEPKNFEVITGKNTVIEVENTPVSSILINKTDANTRKPLAGVRFEVSKENGEKIGVFETDISGRIVISPVSAGKYVVVETEALKGYELDSKAKEVFVQEGKQAVINITNKPMSGLRILKIDSITKKGIFNVGFMVFNENGKVVGTYYSDNNGVVDFAGVLPEGRYTIRETRPAEGYYNDDVPKTVQFEAGKYTEIVWQNVPKMGQIQILKLSGDENEINGLPAGTPLEGAIFEIYAYKSGNLVDRFVSGKDGRAVSKPLPLGRYLVKEVQAPPYYRLSDKQLDVEIEFATQILKLEFTNYSANTGVHIRKTGNVETMPGHTIRYDIKAVQNTGTVPLSDFYWRDILPVDAVRLNKIVTGTYNQSLKYKVFVTTNKGDTRIIADNLSTTKNNVIDCSPASLGLKNDEFVTSFTLMFGTVIAGFAQVEQPQIFVDVLKTLPNGYQFSNKCDVGGKYGSEWVIGNSTWLTTVYRGSDTPLPKTGY